MRWRKLGFWTALTVTALAVLLGTWLLIGDLSVLKPRIERWVSEQTGRDFRIAGRFDLDLGRRSVLVVSDLRLGNATWAEEPSMLSVGRLELHVRTGSLFRGPIVVEQIQLSDTELNLSGRRDGPPNWVFRESSPAAPPASGRRRHGLPLVVQEAFVRSFRLRYTAPARDAPVELAIDSLEQSLGDDRFVTLSLDGSLGGRRLAAEARLGTWEALLDGENVEYDIKLDVDTLEVESKGRIDDLLDPVRPELEFAAKGPDVDDFTRVLGLGERGSGTIDLEGAVEPSDDALELRLAGNLGQSTVAASVRLPDLASFDSVDADIAAKGPDLSTLLAIAGAAGTVDTGEAPFELTVDLERRERTLTVRRAELGIAGATVALRAALPGFPALDDGRIELEADGPDLAALRWLTGLPPGIAGEFSMDFSLEVDAADRERFALTAITSLGRIEANGEIHGGDTYFGSAADYAFELSDPNALADSLSLGGALPPAAPMISTPINGRGRVVYDAGGLRLETPLKIDLAGLSASVGGTIVPSAGLAGSRLSATIDSESLQAVTAMAGLADGIPALRVSARAAIRVDGDAVTLEDIVGGLGTASFAGEASIEPGGGSSLRFRLDGPALEELLTELPDLALKPGPFEFVASLERDDSAFVVEEATLTRPNGEAALRLDAALPWERRSLRFDMSAKGDDVRALLGRIGRFEALPAAYSVNARGQRDGDLLTVDRFDVAIGSAAASASGTLDLRGDVDDTRFRLNVDVPDLAAIGRVDDRAFNAQPFGLEAEIDGRDDTIEARTFRLRFGDSVVDGMLRYVSEPAPNLDVAVLADRIRFEPLLEPADENEAPLTERRRDRLIPDIPLPFAALDGREGRLRLGIGRVERGDLTLRDVEVDAVLDDSLLEIRELSFRAPSGFLRSAAKISHTDGQGDIEVELIADDLAFGLREDNADLSTKSDFSLKLNASGNDLRTLFADLKGAVLLEIAGGEVRRSRFMHAIYGDLFNEIVVTINPLARSSPMTPIECVVVPLDIDAGRVSDKLPSFVATDKIQLSVRAAIDLDSEAIDIGIRSRPKKILTISAAELINPYIKIGGTLARPALAVDEQGVLVTGGAAIATGGLSVLARAAWDRLGRAADPCEAARKSSATALDGRLANLEPLPAETPAGDVSDP